MKKTPLARIERVLTLNPSTIFAYVFSMVVIPLIFPPSDRQAFWNVIVLTWGTRPMGHSSSVTLPEHRHHVATSLPSTSVPPSSTRPKRRSMSRMEQKFYISNPTISWNDSSLSLEYYMSEWVTADVIRYQLFDWSCQSDLQQPAGKGETNENLPIWLVRPPEKVFHRGATVNEPDEYVDFPTQMWRLTLDWNEESAASDQFSHPFLFCVRWMVHNLPTSHEHSMEVTFQRTQLSVHYSRPSVSSSSSSSDRNTNRVKIERVDVSIPEETTIGVNVNGRGRAVVHREL